MPKSIRVVANWLPDRFEVLVDFRQLLENIGGAEGDRTPDLRIANATLSQLSYGPTTRFGSVRAGRPATGRRIMGSARMAVKPRRPAGAEPPDLACPRRCR